MSNARAAIWTPGDSGWSELLERLPHDVFFRPEYHSLPGFGHDGSPHVFSYQESNDKVFLWPYLLRDIPGTDNTDISSVYGYAGPLSSADPDFVHRGWMALTDHWRLQKAVSAFTRFHPLLGNAQLIANLPDHEVASGLCPAGSTVSIDLTLPGPDQVRNYQKVLRQEIRKSRELGFVTTEDVDWADTDSFLTLYRETMLRRNSRDEYLIDEAWVRTLRKSLGASAHLFITRWEGRVAAALIALEHHPFLHAHLTGIDSELAAHSPLKILLDDVRVWGTERGLKSFHLGGGLGGREDSLFQFKRRFSPNVLPFCTGRWVLDAARFRELECAHRDELSRKGYLIEEKPQFFPVYRYHPIGMRLAHE